MWNAVVTITRPRDHLLGLEEQDSAVPQVEVDKVLRLCRPVSIRVLPAFQSTHDKLTVGDEAAEVPSHNAVPCRALALVELCRVSMRPVSKSHGTLPTYRPLDVVGNLLRLC